MKISESSKKMRLIIEKALDEHVISHEDYDKIINLATADDTIDPHERILLKHLDEMLENKTVKFKK
jgi:hypothetical protein